MEETRTIQTKKQVWKQHKEGTREVFQEKEIPGHPIHSI
jgi:hypothetical protein